MSDVPIRVEETDHDKLVGRLEKAANKLQGQNRESFVDSKSLCTTCRWAFIVRQSSKNNRHIRCSSGYPGWVPDDISECNSYTNITELSLGQMAEIATLITNSEKRVGFHHEAK